EKLTYKPGLFEFPYEPAIVNTELVYVLKGEKKIVITEVIIEDAIESVKQIKAFLKILMMDKTSGALDKKETIKELLEAILEHLPNTLPWSKIVKKFERRSPHRTNNSCRKSIVA
ncbi:4550_t:CDS:2, partial [Dentiscutata erythropus]